MYRQVFKGWEMDVKRIKSKKGIAIMEFLFCFFIFAFTLAALYGVWGVIHASILNSIGARTYAFSIIRNRSNVRIAKDFDMDSASGYFDRETRFFGVTTSQPGTAPQWIAPAISIDFMPSGRETTTSTSSPGFLGLTVDERQSESTGLDWSPGNRGLELPGGTGDRNTTLVYLKQGYGICLSAGCDTP